MYSVIIVDDESIIRNGLSRFIEIQNMEFEVLGSFSDGSQAIDFLNENNCDVIITDIRMYDVSGIDLAKFVYENKPYIKVVIISGYEEFEYARKALQYNVKRYLLKPTSFEDVKDLFGILKSELDKERETAISKDLEQKRNDEFVEMMRRQFFVDLLNGAVVDHNEIESRIQALGFPEDFINSGICQFEINICNYQDYLDVSWDYGKEGLITAIFNILAEENNRLFYYLGNLSGKIKAVAISTKSNSESFEIMFAKLPDKLKDILNIDVEINITEEFESIEELITKNGSISTLENEVLDKILDSKCKLIISYLSTALLNEAKNCVVRMVDEVSSLSVEQAVSIIKRFVLLILQKLCHEDLEIQFNIDKELEELKKVTDFEKLKVWASDVLTIVNGFIKDDNKNSMQNVIDKAKNYIEKNFSEDITLDEVAEYFYFNPVYFGRLFKKIVGKTFSEYLLVTKMECATNLLKERRYKIYDISEKVGYKNRKSFTKQFKLYTGYTPKEYCAVVLNMGEENDE